MNSPPTTPESNLLMPEKPAVVALGELRGSLEPATVGDGSSAAFERRARAIRGVLTTTILGLAVFALGWLWWHWLHQPSVRDHWTAVARGRDAFRRGRPDLAVQAVSAVRDEAPGSGEAMTVAGLSLLSMGEYRSARQAFERALKLQPNQFDAATALAELNFGLGNGTRGIEVLQMAARLRPQDLRVWLTMGKVLHDLGDFPKSIQAYEKALALNPDDLEALTGLIGCLMDTDQADQAEPWVTRALGKFPSDAKVLGFAARRAFDANRPVEAIRLADRALARDPKNLDALLTRARAHVVQALWKQALPDAERARAAYPNDLGSLQLLQKIQAKLGMTDQAAVTQAERVRAQDRLAVMDRLNEEINRHPEDPQVLCNMGQTAWEAGSLLLAYRCFGAALALEPNFERARAGMAALQRTQPDLARAPGRSTLFPPAVGMSPPSSVPNPRSDPETRRMGQ
jgi:tetratricopeptide (TPR) repeat protein